MKSLEVFKSVAKRPEMYMRGANLQLYIAFITGYDCAQENGPLAGFCEWLVVKNNSGNNLSWPPLAEDFISGESEEE